MQLVALYCLGDHALVPVMLRRKPHRTFQHDVPRIANLTDNTAETHDRER